MSETNKYKLIISGTVQGVGYRNYVLLEAQKRSMAGYVRNLRNGTVEVHFQASYADKKDFLDKLSIGPAQALVEKIDEQHSHEELPGQFEIFPSA